MGNIQDGEIVFDKLVYSNDLDDNKKLLLQYGDLLFNRTNSAELVGKTAIFRGQRNAIFAGYLILLRPIFINSEYLNLLLNTPYARDYCNEVKTIGVQQCNINAEKISNLLIPVPNLHETVAIVEKIKNIALPIIKYGEFYQKLKHLNRELPIIIRKSILQEAIQGKLVPQIAEEGTARELLEQIKTEKEKLVREGKLKKSALTDSVIFRGDDNKYFEKIGKTEKDITDEIPFEIPNSWCWMRLDNLCNITNGFTPLRTEPKFWENGNINWFTIEDIRKQGEYIYQTTQKITESAVSKDRIVRAGSVLLCCTASVGQCAMTMIPTTTNQQFNALTIKEEYRCLVNDEFLYLFSKTLEPILHDLAGKTTFEFISVKKVGNILIPIPPILEQHRICKITNKAIASIMRG